MNLYTPVLIFPFRMFDALTQSLLSLADSMSVEAFTFIGSLVEEIVAPIPSPIVMTAAGSIAAQQGYPLAYLFALSLIGAVGKTIGALFVYGVAYVLGTVFVQRFGHLLGVTLSDVDALRTRLGKGWHQLASLTFLRALPIMSSMVLSVGCGVVRVSFALYVISTFIGTIVRNFFYLYVGFSGVAAYRALVDGLDGIESAIQIFIGVVVVFFLGWLYWRRHKGKRA
jgi:membrane protein DedA with SNARE-associated domain